MKAYADAMCAANDRYAAAATKQKFEEGLERFSHLRREDYGDTWAQGAAHAKRAKECQVVIESKP
jgi:hypothetical protein